jgi:SAM-dependent methyltransferase
MAIDDSYIDSTRDYWDAIAGNYSKVIRIRTDDFHYGPLLPGDSQLKLLPEKLDSIRCLEIGCGAAQNSIYLSKQGADCVALDISEKQLRSAAKLAEKEGVSIELIHCPMESISPARFGKYDLIHSSYAISFSESPEKIIRSCSEMLRPGGCLLLSTGHPLFAGEWLELDGDMGLFLDSYFDLSPDSRFNQEEQEIVRSNFYPVSVMFDWFRNAGFTVERILEPEPLPVEDMQAKDIPYASRGWIELYEQLKSIPVVIIFKGICR